MISCPKINRKGASNYEFSNSARILLGTELRVFPKSENSFGRDYQISVRPLLVKKKKKGPLFYDLLMIHTLATIACVIKPYYWNSHRTYESKYLNN